MKGVTLAGSSETRLYPLTKATSKQLMSIYNKPMIYYPMPTLILAGIKEILIISTPQDTPRFKELFGNGNGLGLQIKYVVQKSPGGLVQAFITREEFIRDDSVCSVLEGNIYYGGGLPRMSRRVTSKDASTTVFGYHINDPKRFGTIEFDEDMQALSIEKKPAQPKSNYAVTGLYFYDNEVISIAKGIKPLEHGELEITNINKAYLDKGKLPVELMERGPTWLDIGTHGSLFEAPTFIETIKKRQNLKVARLEEIAYRMNYIDKERLLTLIQPLKEGQYGQYLLNLTAE